MAIIGCHESACLSTRANSCALHFGSAPTKHATRRAMSCAVRISIEDNRTSSGTGLRLNIPSSHRKSISRLSMEKRRARALLSRQELWTYRVWTLRNKSSSRRLDSMKRLMLTANEGFGVWARMRSRVPLEAARVRSPIILLADTVWACPCWSMTLIAIWQGRVRQKLTILALGLP